jgi:hypothetical protein
LPEDEREQLLRWPRRAKSAQSLALRSKIVLVCADGLNNTQLVARLGNVPTTVGKCVGVSWTGVRTARWTSRVRGGPRTISDQIEAVIVATLERTPKDATHWSRASMAAESGLSLASVVPRAVIVGSGRLALMLIVESVELLNEADDALTIAFSGCSGVTHQARAPRATHKVGSYRDGT